MTLSSLFFQSHYHQWMVAIFLLLISILFYYQLLLKSPSELKFPIFGYAFFYSLVCLIGGVIVGVSEASWLLQLQPQGGYKILKPDDISWTLYWFLLFLPLFAMPLSLLAVNSVLPKVQRKERVFAFRFDLFFVTLIILFFIASFRNYSVRIFIDWLSGGGDFSEMIRNRGMVLSSLNYFVLNLFYVMAPILVAAFGHSFLKLKDWKRGFYSAVLLVLILAFTILTYQKLLFFMTLLCCGYLLVYKKSIPSALFIGACIAMPTILMGLTLLSNNPYGFFEIFAHFVLRTGSAISYYVAYIGQSYFYPGYDLPLDGRSIEDNVDVFRFMFPNSSWLGGSSSSPFHLRSYFQGGLLFSIIEFIGISFFVNIVVRVKHALPEGQTFFESLLLVFFFYLCQTSLKDCLVSSYGILLTFFILVLMFDFNRRLYVKV